MTGLALCKIGGKNYLFQMPRYEYIEKGQKVIVDMVGGPQDAIVVSTCSTMSDSDEFDMIMQAAGATIPLKKVLKKIREEELVYENDELDPEDTRE